MPAKGINAEIANPDDALNTSRRHENGVRLYRQNPRERPEGQFCAEVTADINIKAPGIQESINVALQGTIEVHWALCDVDVENEHRISGINVLAIGLLLATRSGSQREFVRNGGHGNAVLGEKKIPQIQDYGNAMRRSAQSRAAGHDG